MNIMLSKMIFATSIDVDSKKYGHMTAGIEKVKPPSIADNNESL